MLSIPLTPDVAITLRTPDLYAARAGSAYDCLLPQAVAASAASGPLCAECPLLAVCGEIARRETNAETAMRPATAVAAGTTVATVNDELAARRPRGVRPALIWQAA